MKRILTAVSVVAVLGMAASAMGFGLGDIKEKTGGMSNAAIEAGVNSDIEKKTAGCKFKPNSTDMTCNINKIIDSLTAAHSTLEKSGLANDVNVHFKTNGPNYNLARERYNAIRNKVRARVGYWDYYGDYNKVESDPDGFKMWVKVR